VDTDRDVALGRPFWLIWWSTVISGSGDGMFLTAFPLLAAALTRDAVLIAGVTVASRLPWLLFSLLAGAAADRTDRRRLMVAADVARAIVVVGLAAAVLSHTARIPLLYVCAFALGLGETVHANSAQAMLPNLVAADRLVTANARITGMQVLTETFLGPPIGAALYGAAASTPFLVDGVTFAVSAGLIRSLPEAPPVARASTGLWSDVREGVAFMVRHPLLRRLVALLGTLNFFYFATESVLILYTLQRLHAGKAVYTALFLAAAAGTLATQWLVEPMQARVGAVTTITIAFWCWAVALVGLSFTTTPVVAIVLFFVLGMGDGFWRVLTLTLRQRITPNQLLGRVNSAYRMVAQGIIPLGAAFGGGVAKAFGIRAPFTVAAVVFVVIAAAGPFLLRPAREFSHEA